MKKTNGAVRVHRGASLGARWQEWIVEPPTAKPLPANRAQPESDYVPHEAIARLAYAIWEDRGRPIGSAEQDWLRAEQTLLRKR